jgi:hypothetical protein
MAGRRCPLKPDFQTRRIQISNSYATSDRGKQGAKDAMARIARGNARQWCEALPRNV